MKEGVVGFDVLAEGGEGFFSDPLVWVAGAGEGADV